MKAEHNSENKESNLPATITLRHIIEYAESNKILPSKPPKKLLWNGPTCTLVDLFYQLKKELTTPDGKPYIDSSDIDIAHFLKENFSCFNNMNIETIRGYLNPDKGGQRPKDKAGSKLRIIKDL